MEWLIAQREARNVDVLKNQIQQIQSLGIEDLRAGQRRTLGYVLNEIFLYEIAVQSELNKLQALKERIELDITCAEHSRDKEAKELRFVICKMTTQRWEFARRRKVVEQRMTVVEG